MAWIPNGITPGLPWSVQASLTVTETGAPLLISGATLVIRDYPSSSAPLVAEITVAGPNPIGAASLLPGGVGAQFSFAPAETLGLATYAWLYLMATATAAADGSPVPLLPMTRLLVSKTLGG